METPVMPAWLTTASMRGARTSGPVTCPYPGCGREFPNAWGGRMHYSLAHLNSRKPRTKIKKGKLRGPYKKAKSIGIKPAQETVQAGEKHQHGSAHYCPTCGTNMHAVNLALKIAGEQ